MKRILLLTALSIAMPVFAAAPVAFTPADVKALVAPPAKGVRMVALWALDCAYCEENLSALATWQREHADVDLVFVATDSIGQRDALSARLKAAGLDGVPSRAYADATPDRINYLIDPQWGGETPRTLVIRADGTRKAFSGALSSERIASLVK
ncbi:hypothetical protein BJI69_01600 [Luteibacter rhizovicinus DSM 16549]|uniref:Uncharacterized protein n=1 Tax=Luteibacter rhizovicinus DSM 16549 TaxID=1440763 RepID=A0A0G9H4P5_9GAMM|nr:hypothetical protein [Luteibacter rhizovicinus]APG02730.1 hypothetical protein BJI69_01600 [Luteibacter rhizovicinus DSM 16549]KLD62662.1 signal peptide protein [Luteibacter rhizovicinus DSM 16549]KLD73375.1 signal peptide protein [Xanthomonas hyacinthi DSM 19077]